MKLKGKRRKNNLKKKKNATNAEQPSAETASSAKTAAENSTGQNEETEAAPETPFSEEPSGGGETPSGTTAPPGAPPPSRMDQIEQAVIENRQGINNIIAAIQGQPQQPQNPGVAGTPQQGPNFAMIAQLLPLLKDNEPSPFQKMAQEKMLRGIDLSNTLTEALIKRIALGKQVIPE